MYRYAALFLFIASVFALFVIMKHEFTGYVVFEQGREISERGSSWNRYENNDGTKTLEISDVINYFEGNYKPIAISLRQGCGDYDYCQDKGAYQAYFKANSTGTDIVKYSYNNYEASYTPFRLEYVSGAKQDLIANSLNVIGNADGNKFSYPGIFGQGFDLSLELKD